MMRIREKDTVVVLTGKDKGKQGIVLEVSRTNNKVKVQGVAILTKHVRARRQGEVSQIKRVEGWIDASNVMLFEAAAGRPCRVRSVQAADGTKQRVSVATGNVV